MLQVRSALKSDQAFPSHSALQASLDQAPRQPGGGAAITKQTVTRRGSSGFGTTPPQPQAQGRVRGGLVWGCMHGGVDSLSLEGPTSRPQASLSVMKASHCACFLSFAC